MFELEALVAGDEDVELSLDTRQQDMVFQLVPTEIEGRAHLVSRKYSYGAWVDTSVYVDAHDNCSKVNSLLKSRNAKTCSREMYG